ncbi:hypothetical protein VMCG_08639 [Cytospora schulzeri]|uniref:Major facilitator superfamily (MFS) profile domain-containing protein n=1 Tax=Cytospora schulzeri TaxID=448051 RepID=A0A423VTI9_9PEZI|nr:hypothetical protein VMCG_08639 [Valsa malicola]
MAIVPGGSSVSVGDAKTPPMTTSSETLASNTPGTLQNPDRHDGVGNTEEGTATMSTMSTIDHVGNASTTTPSPQGVPDSSAATATAAAQGQDGDNVVPPEAERTALQNALIMISLCSAVFLSALDTTIVTVAIPTISDDLNSTAGYTWIGSAYLLANAAAAPSWGKISDIWGRKPVLLSAVGVFWVGSLIAGVSVNMGMLIFGRAVQGIGGGGIMTLCNICISDLFSMRKRGLYMGIVALVWAVAGGFGPGVREGLAAVDWLGALLIVGATLMVLLGLEFGGVTHPWNSPTLYVAKFPVIPVRIFKKPSNLVVLALCACHGSVYISASYYLPLFFQGVLGASPLMSGVYVLPYTFVMGACSAVAGFLIKKTGKYLPFIIVGFVLMTLGYGLFLDFDPYANWPKIIIFQIILGLGVGPNFLSPLNGMQKQASTLLAQLGPDVADLLTGSNAASSVTTVSALPDAQRVIAQRAYLTALRTMFIFYVAIAGLGIVLSFWSHTSAETPNISSAAERALLWKQDQRIVPLSAAIYFLCYLDRSNIGNAKILNSSTHDDLMSETGMTNYQYTITLMVFLVAYGLFEIPSNVLLKKLRPSRWIAILMFGWGACSMGLSGAHNYGTVVGVRFLLGFFEAGLFPGLVYYLTFWYKSDERSIRVAFILASATLAGAFGGAIAYGVGHMNQARDISAWRWLFIIEGAPSCLSALFVLFFLPDYPETVKWLSQEERALALRRLQVEGSKGLLESKWWDDASATLVDWRLWGHYAVYFGISTPFSSLSLFTPSITAGLGYEDLQAQLMTVPPYAVAYVVQILVSWSADRFNSRGMHSAAMATVGACGFLASAALPADAYLHRYGCLIIAATGAFACIPPLLGWLSSNIFSTGSVGLAIALNIGLAGAPGQIAGGVLWLAEPEAFQG